MFPGNRVADGSPHSPQAAGEKEAKPKTGQARSSIFRTSLDGAQDTNSIIQTCYNV